MIGIKKLKQINMYYIIFSAYEKGKSIPGTCLAKRYIGTPNDKQREFCEVFNFTIVDEEEFNSITTKGRIIL